MKVAIVNSYFKSIFNGGAENSIYYLAKGLSKRGVSVVIISLSNKHNVVTHDKFEDLNVVYIPYPYKTCPLDRERTHFQKLKWYFDDFRSDLATSSVLTILDQYKVDVVHTNNLAGYSSLLLKRIKDAHFPIVHTIRDYYFLCLKGNLKHQYCDNSQGWICKLGTFLRKNHSNCIDAVIGNSDFILNMHLDYGYFVGSRIKKYIYNGLDGKNIQDVIFPKKRLFAVGYIGRVCAEKGVLEFVEAMNKINSSYKILIAGDGDIEFINKLKKTNNNIVFLGHVPADEFYRAVDFVVVPSLWHEPLARTVFESFFYGIPVIGSNRGGIPESIEHGINGYIYSPDNELEFIQYIKKLIEDDSVFQSMAFSAYKSKSLFDINNTVSAYLNVYKGLCDESSKNISQ